MVELNLVHKAYSSNEILPESVLSSINPELLERYQGGKEVFFHGINNYFPEVYDFLINDTSELHLVDQDGEGELFYWCLGTESKYIFSSIPKMPRDIKVRISERDYYNSLPEELKPFFNCFNGFDFTEENNLHLHETGFLLSFPNWYDYSVIFEYLNDQDSFQIFADKFSNTDIRVIAKGIDGSLILLDMNDKAGGLWKSNWGEISNFKKIQDPVEEMSKMFFNACGIVHDSV